MSAATKPSPTEGAQPTQVAAHADAPSVNEVSPKPDAAGKPGTFYTMTAREGLDAAELVKAAFLRKTIGAVRPRRLEVAAPDGPSTAGGKRARQTIRLVPVEGQGMPTMCGYLDPARKRVELRAYANVAQQHEERFGEPFEITHAEYQALCKELEATLVPFRYVFQHEASTPTPTLSARAQIAPVQSIRRLNVVLLCVALLIAGGILLLMLTR